MGNTNNIKITCYDEEYDEQIIKFVNESMHNFIGRPYKNRTDLLHIRNYYIKNNGVFYIALDDDKIIGTIALENRNNIGILKRFYVDINYQKSGIGSNLYEKVEDYIKNETNIVTIYLTCNRVLQNAHEFYQNRGFIKIDNPNIDMHYIESDDFFKKVIY